LLFDDHDSLIWRRNLRPISSISEKSALPQGAWQEYARLALDLRPDLRGTRFDMRQAEIDLESARRDLLPQLDLIGLYSTDGVRNHFNQAFTDSTGFDFPDWSVQLELSVPIGNSAARAAFRQAELEVERTRRILYTSEQAIQLEVRDSLRQLRTLDESIIAAEESVRLAETVLDSERERLKVGRATIFEVQQRNQELSEARRQLLRNQLDYRIAEDTFLHSQGILRVPDGAPR
jgi:outer membrane protein TolC